MKNKILSLVCATLLLTTGPSVAADFSFGIGVDINNGTKIFLPMYIGGFIVEPIINLSSMERKKQRNTALDYEINNYEVGVGLFKDSKISDATHVYYGARLSYTDFEYITTSIDSSPGAQNGWSITDVSTGYIIAPSIGAQYYITRQFSLAIDIGFEFWKEEGTSTSSNPSPNPSDVSDIEDSGHNTKAAFIARYQFF